VGNGVTALAGRTTVGWKSSALRAYQGRTQQANSLIASIYLAGTNTVSGILLTLAPTLWLTWQMLGQLGLQVSRGLARIQWPG
jgi:hypothetical protein